MTGGPDSVPSNPTRVVNRRTERYDVYIGRGSEWGNPFPHRPSRHPDVIRVVGSREESIECYRTYLWERINAEGAPLIEALALLYGRTLGCYCKPRACHGDVLARAAQWAALEVQKRELRR